MLQIFVCKKQNFLIQFIRKMGFFQTKKFTTFLRFVPQTLIFSPNNHHLGMDEEENHRVEGERKFSNFPFLRSSSVRFDAAAAQIIPLFAISVEFWFSSASPTSLCFCLLFCGGGLWRGAGGSHAIHQKLLWILSCLFLFVKNEKF